MRYVGLDLSTKTGLVILDESGQVIKAEEITTKEKSDPQRMIILTEKIMSKLKDDDVIAIEGFSYGSRGRGVSLQFGYGYAVRIALFTANKPFLIVTPSQVKKYATGKGNSSKDNMILPMFKKWGFEHDSDNVRDAYVLAKIAFDLKVDKEIELKKYESEILRDLRKDGVVK